MERREVRNRSGEIGVVGDSPFQRVYQTHSAEYTCTSVSRTDLKLLPRSRVYWSAVEMADGLEHPVACPVVEVDEQSEISVIHGAFSLESL